MKKILSILVCVCVLLSAMVMTVSADSATYTKIDTVENLEAGDYIMAAYLTKDSNNADLSATPYQCFTGSVGSGKLYTSKYSFTDGVLTTSESYKMVEVTLAAIEGKANTYTLHVANKGYIYSTSSTANHKLAIDENNAMEWTASNHSGGGIIFTASNGTVLGTASATSQFIRGYKAGSTTPTGMYFFEETTTTGGNEPTCEHTAKSAVPNGDETHKLVCDACSETVTPVVDCTDADANGKCDVCEGDVEVSVPDPTPDSTLTIAEAIALGETKEHNTYTDGKYYVVGVVESVYNTQYGNMYIVDEAGNRLTIYGTYDATGENGYAAMEDAPVAGDTVKLYGKIGYYSSAAQMKNAWIVEVTPGETPAPENNDPAAESVLTIEQALALGATKTHNTYTENKYYVTGVITEIYNETYGNMKITDEAGNILTVYGTWDETGEIRFDAMETKPAVGDTVTVYGVIGQYNGTAQMKNGWFKAAPAVDDDDDTTGGNTTGGDSTTGGATTGGATTGGSTTNNNANTNTNTDNSTTSPDTGDNVGAFAVMAIAAAAVVIAASKKRA